MAQATFRIYHETPDVQFTEKKSNTDKQQAELKIEIQPLPQHCIYNKTNNNAVEAHIETLYGVEDML